MIDSKTFWDKTAARYEKSPIRDLDAYKRKLAITQGYFKSNWSVLEFGCGTGSTAIQHSPYVNNITATDISDKMLEIAKQKTIDASIKNIIFQQGTLDTLKLTNESFNAILGLNILHLLQDIDTAIARTYELLKPGGIFISSTVLLKNSNWRLILPIMQFLKLAPYVNPLDKQDLSNKLTQAGFSIEKEWQPGKGSVFFVAKKQVSPNKTSP
ncbi:class I SAM-dependent methyltransferase [Microbulbifer sp. VAAF005]|uniref:class I SAM-dependent DNA methyltransferase n=1 Tax=Microbulbifer sp. VAAF005 TaxID=3034230 RepID=UPI0024AC9DD1|nr:class I SAM-dependent methyltransferase [Microbulbifer sp. VAAF005]WHI48189.1 class I SAM-dependent methyltransferase [Microbulbifer sp. VAAF005]